MNLVLRGLTLNDNPLSQPLVGRFDESGGSVGRSDNATMTLPDPERLISRVQANVSYGANIYWLEDVGSANPVVHNGLPLGPGVKVPLKPNDELRIGGYRLAVEYEQSDTSATIVRRPVPARAEAPLADAPAAAPPSRPTPVRAGGNPLADLLRSGNDPSDNDRGSDPYADLMKPAARAPGARDKVPPGPGTRGALPPRDAFDPFAPLDAPSGPAPSTAPDSVQPSEAGGRPEPIDPREVLRAVRGAPPALDARAEPRAALDAAPETPPKVPVHAVRDFDAALKAVGSAASPKAKAATKKSAPAATPPAARRASAAAATPPSSYTADEIWNGFLEGAGVDVDLPRGVTPEMMRTIGVMLRSSVEGMLDLIAVRAAAKNELRAPVTVIQVRENNPLKFSPDATVALLQLLQPPGRGFLPGPEAIRDAMIDLQSHQIGTMAGMRAALAGVLERFKPELLEGRLTGQSMLDALLPMNRKAKLWELFLQHYRLIRHDAEEDFHELFGKAFVEAYNAQVEKLEQAHAADHPPGAPDTPR